jgi:Tyrosyl-DNA phosphodiesterase
MLANAPPNIRFCFPSITGQFSRMHSKLQLLSHPTHLRIAVPSANLMPYDWGESGGVLENVSAHFFTHRDEPLLAG